MAQIGKKKIGQFVQQRNNVLFAFYSKKEPALWECMARFREDYDYCYFIDLTMSGMRCLQAEGLKLFFVNAGIDVIDDPFIIALTFADNVCEFKVVDTKNHIDGFDFNYEEEFISQLLHILIGKHDNVVKI